MNALATSRAAEGFDRISWTVQDVFDLQAAGFIQEDASFELWEGEIVPMKAKRNRHEIWKTELLDILIRSRPDDVRVKAETSVYFSDRTFLEPDIVVAPRDILPEDLRGPDLLLAIEVSDASLGRDLRRKAELYARFGVRHYWVLDAERRRAFVHRLQADGTYGSPEEHGSDAVLRTPYEPVVEVALAGLG